MWALVDTNAPTRDRAFIITATGHPVDPSWEYIGTAVTAAGMVWHVHEEVPF